MRVYHCLSFFDTNALCRQHNTTFHLVQREANDKDIRKTRGGGGGCGGRRGESELMHMFHKDIFFFRSFFFFDDPPRRRRKKYRGTEKQNRKREQGAKYENIHPSSFALRSN